MRQPKIKLQPCPHCGSAKAPMFWCSSEALPEDCECEDAGNGESFAAVCDAVGIKWSVTIGKRK